MTPIPASLVIVSRHRTASLMRTLAGVCQMDHPQFEVIVVADPDAAQSVRQSGLKLKLATFDRANISEARNIGLSLASAPVVAFLDDDAVPEPTWLSRLVAPFETASVVAAGGYVLGRSGLAWQWRANWITADGFDESFEPGDGVSLHTGTPQRAVKTQGTNCAFRRNALLDIGGFDPGFAFYLDDADVNLRLAAGGGLTAIVPNAVVHHGFAASARRRADRVPTDLIQIGQSLRRFLTRHGTGDLGADATALARHVAAQRRRLLRHMVEGALEPRDVRRLMRQLHDGLASAPPRIAHFPRIAPSALPLIPLPGTGPRAGHFLWGSARNRAQLERESREAVAQGKITTTFILSRGLRAQRHFFSPEGWWVQTGGRFGRSFRGKNRFNWQDSAQRRVEEMQRLSVVRPINGPCTPK